MKKMIFGLLLIVALTSLAACTRAPSGQTVCAADVRMCPDGQSYVDRDPANNCEFRPCPAEDWEPIINDSQDLEAIECTAAQREAEACTMEYAPVCGWFSQEVQCIKYPCAMTYGNACGACADEKVAFYTQGECPDGNTTK
jgi:hypothetical protein